MGSPKMTRRNVKVQYLQYSTVSAEPFGHWVQHQRSLYSTVQYCTVDYSGYSAMIAVGN